MKTIFGALLLGALRCLAGPEPVAFGYNQHRQLGDGTTTDSAVPVSVLTSGVLSGKTLVAVSAGQSHSVAVADDGSVYAWGSGLHGELGNGTYTMMSDPVTVDMTGVLSGKKVVSVAAGDQCTLALTDDGKVYGWGYGSNYLFGNPAVPVISNTPVEVDMSGALSGKFVTAIAIGTYQAYALTSDGLVFAWGANFGGGIGDGTTTARESPVAVDTSGVLSGKFITAIAATFSGAVALATDGKLYGWGYNSSGRIGDGTTTDRHSPVEVDMSGALRGKTIVAMDGGSSGVLVLCSDGTLYAWGNNTSGFVGDGTTTNRTTPTAVDMSGVLSGKSVTAVSAGSHCCVLTSDGEVISWGQNFFGQVGDGSTTMRTVPVAVDASGVLAGMAASLVDAGFNHSMVLAAPVTSSLSLHARYSYAANFGWLNWRPRASGPEAPAVHSSMLSGRVYAANTGWIDLGDGAPTDKIRYSQTGGDIGVNHDGSGGLHGYAYGANIGWIKFAQTWKNPPRIDLTTGMLSGYAYSANCGWIGLAGLKTTITRGPDTDLAGLGDGIEDAWEYEQLAANGKPADLSLLGGFADDDSDHDGFSDRDEFLADTNPFSAAATPVAPSFGGQSGSTLTLEWIGSPRRVYQIRAAGNLSSWDPVGGLLTGTGEAVQIDIALPPGAPRKFFRVEPLLPLTP